MKQNKREQEEEVIRRMLANTFQEEGFELDVEDAILKEVYISKNKLAEIAPIKRKAIISLVITSVILLFFGLTSTNMFFASLSEMEQASDSVFAFNLCAMVGVFIVFYQAIYLSNPTKNIFKN